MRYLDPKNDLTFKKVFGQHPHLLRSFLNALLPLDEGQEVVDLEYLPADMVPIIPLLKYSIVDVRCTDNRGRQFIVEMQMLWTDTFKHRVLFNASKAYVKQLDRGKEYKGLRPVYALSLVNENFEHDTDLYYHHYSMIHNELTGKKIEGLELIFVELPKFKAKNLSEKKLQVLWLRYLTEIEEQTEQPPADLMEVPEIKEAIAQLAESAFSKSELESYDKYWDSISSEKTLISEAEETGRLVGEQLGLEKGLKQGREEGIKAGKMEIARKLQAQGMTAEQIMTITGLDLADLAHL
ncbi:MAG: Rpn family recombination-promoting nuclease/putative transposase [Bacteroidota bacterium]